MPLPSRDLLPMCAWYLFVVLQLASGVSFGPRETRGQLTDARITEASGLAVSRVHQNVGYTHNDKGGLNEIYAFDIITGATVATIVINNATNWDWEDLTYGPCFDDCNASVCSAQTPPSRYCIYVADTGDHAAQDAANIIYAIREPFALQDARVDLVGVLRFSWTEVDAETLMMSPSGQLFIMSKVDGGQAKVAEIPAAAWNRDSVTLLDMSKTAVLKINTNSNDPQGGDISPDGKNVILIGEHGIYYLSVTNNDYIKSVQDNIPVEVSTYQRVKDSEGIAWSSDGKGFYIVAEGKNSTVYFYSFDEAGLIVG
ncbi:unnamed protein product [Lymnaea stagnalis]|uniref:Dipeptidylpeptidase IV N-terminal domain-containing protein n=1 Tax=Lymnaea stagnalis TaxID=6523 RepID=A0AAV2HY90_LYMST